MTAIINSVSATAAATIVITVKDGDTVTAKVANIKKHPDQGLLVSIEGNPMAFLPNSCLAGKNKDEKAARRAFLIANAGTELSAVVMGEPSIVEVKGKPAGRITVSEQRAILNAEKAAHEAQNAARQEALVAAVAALEVGSIVSGKVNAPATKDSDREPGKKHTYGAFIDLGNGLSGLLHMREVDGGARGLDSILARGEVKVEILEAAIENGRPRIKLSQSSIAGKALEQWALDHAGKTYKGKVAKVGEVVGNLHGRIIELTDNTRLFLADDDMNVKSEASLARGNTTSVKITGEVIGGMVRVTRR